MREVGSGYKTDNNALGSFLFTTYNTISLCAHGHEHCSLYASSNTRTSIPSQLRLFHPPAPVPLTGAPCPRMFTGLCPPNAWELRGVEFGIPLAMRGYLSEEVPVLTTTEKGWVLPFSKFPGYHAGRENVILLETFLNLRRIFCWGSECESKPSRMLIHFL